MDMEENRLPFLDYALHLEKDGRLNIEVYQKPTCIDQYLLFNSHKPLEYKLRVIRTLYQRADNIPTRTDGKSKEHKNIKTALKICGYPNWAYVKFTLGTTQDEGRNKYHNVVILHVAGVSEKFRRIF